MKTLVVYSSRTGNTRKIAEAIAQVLPACELYAVEEAPSAVDGYDLVAVGFWADKGMPDAKARAWLEGVSHARLALFGTLGALPDSGHARDCMALAEALVREPERGNTICGTWMCQGKIDPEIVRIMKKLNLEVHREMLRDDSRIEEAAKHPDDSDCHAAQAFFRGVVEQVAAHP